MSTKLIAAPVINASPRPISEWKLTISVNTFAKSISLAGHDRRNSTQNRAAAAITLHHAATTELMTMPLRLSPTNR